MPNTDEDPYTLTIIDGSTFIDGDVVIDGNYYTNCHFDKCRILLLGTKMFQFGPNCSFNQVEFGMEGPASIAFRAIQMLYLTNSEWRNVMLHMLDRELEA